MQTAQNCSSTSMYSDEKLHMGFAGWGSMGGHGWKFYKSSSSEPRKQRLNLGVYSIGDSRSTMFVQMMILG